MRVALGFNSHSGWAALVAVGEGEGGPAVVERCRVELVEAGQGDWARQPYHAAEGLDRRKAESIVKKGILAARRCAAREMKAAIRRVRQAGHQPAACGVLVGDPMPGWSVHEILAVHLRMHQAEGVLFRDVLVEAASACRLASVTVPAKRIREAAKKSLGAAASCLPATVARLGKSIGPPWGKDQKDAAVAALIALRATRRS